jgi:hypothetical protein
MEQDESLDRVATPIIKRPAMDASEATIGLRLVQKDRQRRRIKVRTGRQRGERGRARLSSSRDCKLTEQMPVISMSSHI